MSNGLLDGFDAAQAAAGAASQIALTPQHLGEALAA